MNLFRCCYCYYSIFHCDGLNRRTFLKHCSKAERNLSFPSAVLPCEHNNALQFNGSFFKSVRQNDCKLEVA